MDDEFQLITVLIQISELFHFKNAKICHLCNRVMHCARKVDNGKGHLNKAK